MQADHPGPRLWSTVVAQRGDLDVAIATNAGFAASADRPLLSEEAQNAKLRLIETIARYYWGNEI